MVMSGDSLTTEVVRTQKKETNAWHDMTGLLMPADSERGSVSSCSTLQG
jgi:hypothetical protein